jgi:hypothetical protein
MSRNVTSFSHQTPTLDSLFDFLFKTNLWISSKNNKRDLKE